MDLFTLSAKLTLDTSDYEQKIADVVKSAQEAGEKIDKALSGGTGGGGSSGGSSNSPVIPTGGGTGDASGSGFGTMVKSILTSKAIQRGFAALVKTGKKSVALASDLVEIQNVQDSVFQNYSAQVNEWAKRTAPSFGLTELQAKDYASQFGAIFSSMGVATEEAAQMSMRLSELAGDMASFHNLDFDTAFTKLKAGIVGESEPLRSMGLDLTAQNLTNWVYENPEFENGYKIMSAAEKGQARYAYIMEQTKPVQGDFARTEDEFANSSRTLENNWNRFLGSLGEKVFPSLKTGANAANDLFAALYDESAEKSLSGIDADAADAIANIGQASDTARAAVGVLNEYGDKAALSAEQQKAWETVAGELVRTIPELGSLINMQTGEIEGGTAALEENISAWEESSKAAAKTSALEAKKGLLSDISDEIAREQGLLALAEKQFEQSGDDVVSLGAAIAKTIGEDFGGTVEDTRKLLSTDAGFFAAMDYPGASEMLSGYTAAEEAIASHKENIAALKTDYATVQASIETGSTSMSDTVGDASTSITSSLGNIETSMNSVIDGFDQSETAYERRWRPTTPPRRPAKSPGYPSGIAVHPQRSLRPSRTSSASSARTRLIATCWRRRLPPGVSQWRRRASSSTASAQAADGDAILANPHIWGILLKNE